MPATRISVHARFVNLGEELVVEHVENGWVQVFDLDYRGGSGVGADYLAVFAVVEPIADAEAKRHAESHVPGEVAERFRSFEAPGAS